MGKGLYRDPQNGVVAGVCAGIAAFFGWDRMRVRAAWIALTLLGIGLPAYLITMTVMPRKY